MKLSLKGKSQRQLSNSLLAHYDRLLRRNFFTAAQLADLKQRIALRILRKIFINEGMRLSRRDARHMLVFITTSLVTLSVVANEETLQNVSHLLPSHFIKLLKLLALTLYLSLLLSLAKQNFIFIFRLMFKQVLRV